MGKLHTFIIGLLMPYALVGQTDAPSDIKIVRSDSLYQAAIRAFSDENWPAAAKWLSRYLKENPVSPYRPKAQLLHAQALFKQQKFSDCFNLLNNNISQASDRSDEYNFWMAECRLRLGNNQAAADLFAQIRRSHKLSVRRAEASVSESIAQLRMNHWQQAVNILRPNDNPFKVYAKSNLESELVRLGNFVLADAMLNIDGMENDASSILTANTNTGESDTLQQRFRLLRAFVLSKKNFADRQKALEIVNALSAEPPTPLHPELLKLRAQICTSTGNNHEAYKAWSELIRKNFPPSYRQIAVLNKLFLVITASNQWCFELLKPGDEFGRLLHAEDSPVVQYTLGELYLKQQSEIIKTLKPPDSQTNTAILAASCFEKAQNSPFDLQARKGLGWVGWLQKDFQISATNFLSGIQNISQKHFCRIKAAEAMTLDGNYSNVINYCKNELADSPPLSLGDKTRLLLINAISNLNSDIISRKIKLAEKTLDEFISPSYRARAHLLVSRAHLQAGNREKATAALREITQNAVINPLKAEADLESLRPLLRERRWVEAIKQYSKWIADHNQTAKPELIAHVEFDLAWMFARNSEDEKALNAFTNYIKKHQSRPDAAQAQMWIGDHYFNLGGAENLAIAERAYQKIYSKFTNANAALKYRAKIMAGHSANNLNKVDIARTYFMLILSDKDCPAEFKSEAAFGLGNASIQDIKLQVDRFDAAIGEFHKVITLTSTPANILGLEARCRIGDCHLQMAAVDNRRYEKALAEYRAVRDISAELKNDPPVRFKSILGMAEVLRLRKPDSDPRQALELYNEVFYGAGLAGNSLDSYWLKQSGLAAGRLHEELGQHQNAISTYRRLIKFYPKMENALIRLIDQSKARLKEKALPETNNN